MVAQRELSALEEALGKTISPLNMIWADSLGVFQKDVWQDGFNHHKETGHEIFFSNISDIENSDDDPEGKVYMLVRHKNGQYTGLWVDPEDEYDAALINQDYETALDIAEQRLKENPEDPSSIFDKAYALSYSGNTVETVKLYKEVLELEPNNAAAWNNIAIEYEAQGNSTQALKCYKTAQELEPNSVLYNLNYADALKENGDMKGYFEHLERAYNISPKGADERLTLYNAKESSGLQSLEDVQKLKNEYLNPPASVQAQHLPIQNISLN